MGPRAALSTSLIVGAAVLLLAIAVGNQMGNRVLGQVPRRIPQFSMTPIPLPTPTTGNAGDAVLWKRVQVLSAATDPGFPDPRITPSPEPPPRPRPTPTPSPSPTARPPEDRPPYTSPPLPIPLVTHGASPGATPAPSQSDEYRPFPTPTLNPP